MIRRLVTVGLIAAVGVVGPATTAWAHADLVRSDPSSGQELDSSPSRITLVFTEVPDPQLSSVTILDQSGNEVPTGPLAPAPGDPATLVVPPTDQLPDGVYTVSWRVVSQADGHFTANAFAFGVGVSPATAPRPRVTTATTPTSSPLGIAGKILLYAGLSLLLAAAFVGTFAFGGTVPARPWVLAIGSAAALGGALLMVTAESRIVGVGVADLLRAPTGGLYVRLLVAVAVAGALAIGALVAGGTISLFLAGAGAAAAALARADGGHAAASTDLAWLQVGVQWLHLLSVGVWIGGLVLVLLLLRSRRGATPPEREVRRFSFLAGILLGVVVLTGVLREVNEIGAGAVLHLFRTSYGTTLAIKAMLAAALISLGAINRYRSIPRMTSDGGGLLRRVVTGEVVAGAVIFGVVATLTGLPPRPQAAAAPSRPASITARASDFATTMTVRLTATPGTPGQNRFDLRIADFDSGAPLPVDHVSLRFASLSRRDVGSSSLHLTRANDVWGATGTALSIPGVWTVDALIQRGATGTDVPLTLTVPNPEATTMVSRASGQPDVFTITFPDGDQLEAYADPGTAGANQLHATAFDATGNELPLASATVIAVGPGGTPVTVRMDRFSPGHFAGTTDLAAGPWTITLTARTRDGEFLMASFRQTIAG